MAAPEDGEMKPGRDYSAIPTHCDACGAKLVLILYDNGAYAPPLEPPTRESHTWVRHNCPGQKGGRAGSPVHAPECSKHILRPSLEDRWAAYDRATRERVPEGQLDGSCRRALDSLRRGKLAHGDLFT
jgi:hypothetical protein